MASACSIWRVSFLGSTTYELKGERVVVEEGRNMLFKL